MDPDHCEALLVAKDEEIEALRSRLRCCLNWMEETRACGDCGNWDWLPGDIYTRGREILGES
jgi:hypothetical protein